MDIKEMRKLKEEELQKELERSFGELRTAKKEVQNGKEKNVKKSLRIKRNIARIQTVLNEKGEK